MKKTPILALAILLLAGSLAAQKQVMINRQVVLDSLVAAEHAFARLARERSTKEAFLANLADDSVLFGPDLTAGKDLWENRQESPSLFSWYPIYADLSLAGDLGYTTGPWEFRAKRDAKEADAYGDFVTVWKKQKDGSWKVMFDQGVSHPKPAGQLPPAIPRAKPDLIDVKALPQVIEGLEARNLLTADRDFALVAEAKDDLTAYLGVLAEGARLYRTGRQPIVGRDSIRATLGEKPTPMTWAPAAAHVSKSGELGYTYGLAKRRQSGPDSPWVDSDNYLRIWKKQEGGWKLVVDVFDPRPVKSPEGPKPKEP